MAKRVDNSAASRANYPTQLSVAKEAGLSRTTVAEILTGKRLERYNDETQRKVFEAAQRLNYRPHRSAQEVRRGRSNLIGVFHSGGPIQAASERALGLGRAIMRSGFELFLNDGLWYDGNIEHSIEQMLSARVEGVIISGPLQINQGSGKELISALQSTNIPVVSISSYFTQSHFTHIPAIEADFAQGFAALTEHLIKNDCRRLLLEATPTLTAGRYRYDGFQRALAAKGGALHPQTTAQAYRNPWYSSGLQGILVDMEPDFRSHLQDPCGCGATFLEMLLERNLEADAILCSNDYRAFGMLTTCYRRGIQVPEALAFTGADNSYLSRQGPVALTTIEQPTEEMCNLAVETLLHHIKGTATSRHHGATLPCKVIVRTSSTHHALATP